MGAQDRVPTMDEVERALARRDSLEARVRSDRLNKWGERAEVETACFKAQRAIVYLLAGDMTEAAHCIELAREYPDWKPEYSTRYQRHLCRGALRKRRLVEAATLLEELRGQPGTEKAWYELMRGRIRFAETRGLLRDSQHSLLKDEVLPHLLEAEKLLKDSDHPSADQWRSNTIWYLFIAQRRYNNLLAGFNMSSDVDSLQKHYYELLQRESDTRRRWLADVLNYAPHLGLWLAERLKLL